MYEIFGVYEPMDKHKLIFGILPVLLLFSRPDITALVSMWRPNGYDLGLEL